MPLAFAFKEISNNNAIPIYSDRSFPIYQWIRVNFTTISSYQKNQKWKGPLLKENPKIWKPQESTRTSKY